MKIIALTDLHAKTAVISDLTSQIQSAELVLLCGDITHFGRAPEMGSIIRQFRGLNPNIYAVSGNCDYPETEKYLVEENISLHTMVRKFNGYNLFGISGSLPCPGRTPHEYSEEEYEAILDNLMIPANNPLIIVSHQPPYHTKNDHVSPGSHVGSKSIRLFIEKHQPVICFTGHIHEGIAIDHINDTTIVNPGPAGRGNYVVAEIEGKSLKNIQLHNIFSE